MESLTMMEKELKGIKAVVFDFDGTLAVLNIDFSFMRKSILELIANFGISEKAIKESYILELINEVYEILIAKSSSLALDFYQKAHQIIQDIEIKAATEGRLISGALETLKTLREKGFKIGIVTRNCEEAVRKVFPDIDEYCDLFISRDRIVNVKPHPDHLNSITKALNISAKQALMVGDHPIDIQVGKKVGMKTVGVMTGRTKKEEFEKAGADYILKEVSEVGLLLSRPSKNSHSK